MDSVTLSTAKSISSIRCFYMSKRIIIFHAQFLMDKCKNELMFARELLRVLPVDNPGDLEFTHGELQRIEGLLVDWFGHQIELQNNQFEGVFPLDVGSVMLRNSVLREESSKTAWRLHDEIIDVHQRITHEQGWIQNVRCLCAFNIPTAVLLTLQDLRRCLVQYMKIMLNHSQNLSSAFQYVYNKGVWYIVDNSFKPVILDQVVQQIPFQ